MFAPTKVPTSGLNAALMATVPVVPLIVPLLIRVPLVAKVMLRPATVASTVPLLTTTDGTPAHPVPNVMFPPRIEPVEATVSVPAVACSIERPLLDMFETMALVNVWFPSKATRLVNVPVAVSVPLSVTLSQRTFMPLMEMLPLMVRPESRPKLQFDGNARFPPGPIV